MAGFESFHVSAPIAEALERAGLSADQPRMAEIVPTAARGTNLVVVAPPAAAHALPGLAGVLSGVAAKSGLLLILTEESALAEWEAAVGDLAAAAGVQFHAVRSLSRALRVNPTVLIATPASALALMQRSALKTDQLSSILLGFPEAWQTTAELAAIMQDVGEIQRVVYTSDPSKVADLVERYARRAHTVPLPEQPVTGNVRFVISPWTHRRQVADAVVDLLDPEHPTRWSLNPEHRTLSPAPSLIVVLDLPTPVDLAELAAVAPVVLIVPPHAATWVHRIVPGAKPLRLPGAADTAAGAAASHRAAITAALEQGPLDGGLLALAPLFDRYDPAEVAAALYQLWLELPAATAPAPAPQVLDAATARLWVSVGKKDGATPNDFVAMLTRDVGLERGKIGRIEVRELYSLVEVPAVEAEALVGRLTGQSVRRRRITARIDRGARPRSAPRTVIPKERSD